ncbi:dTDP-4-dehydrorhamnose 3,5-epimerase [Sinorhizobium sojae CCBAU 05684]|uniref:dTDP-4-dehydrorhamnose 3,5-epimerase n=1 Tax=Sinorhizobium sojae CCBAU 05684 TaxID=716928 RepID=A0A249PCH2_9HYPH|nr:dTDP-4-dehydrorhamnose 3,5-epimerase [Sinorhizobium sojae]ASY63462.1 dTDP-4-dehydrorhamnose 3,5-epimerase [Sinorhizobium sojae CCBAU 05684]
MKFGALPIAGAFLIDIEERKDERGFFARTFCVREFASQGLETVWVQMNTSLTKRKGSVRGMHFQRRPSAEAKLVRCVKGAVFDVIVDLRKGSPTYGHWHGVELTHENRTTIYIPTGCAHGFQTLEGDTELLYLHSAFYSPEHEAGLRFDDPDIAISWPLPITEISLKDRQHPSLTQLGSIPI